MHTRTLLAAIATAAVAAIATPSLSLAQNPTTTSKGDVALAPSFGSLISAINATSARNDKIKAMTDLSATNVQLVNVEDLLKGNNVEALNAALQKNEADIATLRTTLGANTTITSVLTANATPTTTTTTPTTAAAPAITANDIVAADVGADGKVILYYWKKQG
jgi:hypothetical protein